MKLAFKHVSNMQDRIKLAKRVSFTELDNDAVLLNLESGTYFGLNHIGVQLVKSINNGLSVSEACVTIATRYKVDLDVVKSDINELIKEMINNDLIENLR